MKLHHYLLRLIVVFVFTIAATTLTSCGISADESQIPTKLKFTPDELMNKIKGGWAGQTIGVTYGGPTEFDYRGKTIGDDVQVPWGEEQYVKEMLTESSWLYDDIYMDLTFVEVFERLGVDAPVDSLAMAFAHAPYPLWHANHLPCA